MAERRRRRSTECTEEESEDSEQYETEEEETAEEDDVDDDAKSTKTTEGERQSGDGEEQPKLDDDEDRQNPCYIPRRGAFYEHDMRLDPDEKVGGEADPEEKRGKGKLWKDNSKWGHDKFDAYDQAPKSRQELIAAYGYDIYQHDKPPENAPRGSGRGRRGGDRDRKPQFQDFLPEDGGKRRGGYNRGRYGNDQEGDDYGGPRQSSSDTTHNYRGRGARRGRGMQHRRAYTEYSDSKPGRHRTNSDGQDDDFPALRDNRDTNSNKDSYRNRDRDYNNSNFEDSYGNKDTRDNYGKRDSFGNRDSGGPRDSNRNRDNYGKRDNYNKRDSFGNRDNAGSNRDNYGNRDRADRSFEESEKYEQGQGSERGGGRGGYRDRDNNRGGRGGFRGNRSGNQDGPRDNRDGPREFSRDSRDTKQGGRGRSSAEYERQSSTGSGRDRDVGQYGKDMPGYDRQYSGGNRDRDSARDSNRDNRDIDHQYGNRRQNVNDVRDTKMERDDTGTQDTSLTNKYRIDAADRQPARAYEKPSPKSYYTLSVTDDEKLMEDDYVGSGAPERIQDMNVTVTGDRRSFKDRDRPRQPGTAPSRGQEFKGTQQGHPDDRRDVPAHGSVSKHQPTLPPRLQQQQQQERNKRQKQQPPSQPLAVDKQQDAAASRSNKRYSSQRQRAVPEVAGFTPETQIPQSAPQPQQNVGSPLPQQYPPNFSPPKPAGGQAPVIVGPSISPQRNAPPQLGVQSPTMVITRAPPPQTIIPVPGGAVPPIPVPPPQQPPPSVAGPVVAGVSIPGAGPPGPGAPPGIQAPPPAVFAQVTGTLPSTGVIGAPPPQLIQPAGIAPTGIIYAGPPPAFQVPVPQFTAAPPVPSTQVAAPGETVRGGTTYYAPQSAGNNPKSSGTTYYSPEMQMSKQSRVQVRRPKVPLPIINPQDVRGDQLGDSPKQYQDEEDEYLEEGEISVDENVDDGAQYDAGEQNSQDEYYEDAGVGLEERLSGQDDDQDSKNVANSEYVAVSENVDESENEPQVVVEEVAKTFSEPTSSEPTYQENVVDKDDDEGDVSTRVDSHQEENVETDISKTFGDVNVKLEPDVANVEDPSVVESETISSQDFNNSNNVTSSSNDEEKAEAKDDEHETVGDSNIVKVKDEIKQEIDDEVVTEKLEIKKEIVGDANLSLDLDLSITDESANNETTDNVSQGAEPIGETFVVKTEAVTPTLSISTGILPVDPDDIKVEPHSDDDEALQTADVPSEAVKDADVLEDKGVAVNVKVESESELAADDTSVGSSEVTGLEGQVETAIKLENVSSEANAESNEKKDDAGAEGDVKTEGVKTEIEKNENDKAGDVVSEAREVITSARETTAAEDEEEEFVDSKEDFVNAQES